MPCSPSGRLRWVPWSRKYSSLAVELSVCLMGGLCYILVSMYHKELRKTVSLGLDEETEVQRWCNTLRASSSTSQRKSQVWASGGLGGVVEVLFALINTNKTFVSKTLDSFFFS